MYVWMYVHVYTCACMYQPWSCGSTSPRPGLWRCGDELLPHLQEELPGQLRVSVLGSSHQEGHEGLCIGVIAVQLPGSWPTNANKGSYKLGVWNPPLSWALAPGCKVLMLMQLECAIYAAHTLPYELKARVGYGTARGKDRMES